MQDYSQKEFMQIGKLRGNKDCNRYHLFSHGLNPHKLPYPQNVPASSIRNEICSVFIRNVKGIGGLQHRVIKAVTPSIKSLRVEDVIQEEELLQKLSNEEVDRLLPLNERPQFKEWKPFKQQDEMLN